MLVYNIVEIYYPNLLICQILADILSKYLAFLLLINNN